MENSMGETEKKLLADEQIREEMEAAREKWITNRRRQRAHFQQLAQMMRKLNKEPSVDTGAELWEKAIEPNIQE